MEDTSCAQFQPNQEMLESLLNIGISKEAGEQALFITGNQSAEAAASFLFENPDFSCDTVLQARGVETTVNDETNVVDEENSSESSEEIDSFKMVFVINTSLKMGVGKIAAQVGHACLGLYRQIIAIPEQCELLNKWENIGEKKIVLKGRDMEHLQELQNLAKEHKLPTCLIHDAGHTQIAAGSVTVLGLFGEDSLINKVTGKLNLL